MNLAQITDPIRQGLGLAAVVIAAIVVLKLFGVAIPMRASTLELAAAGILCALAK